MLRYSGVVNAWRAFEKKHLSFYNSQEIVDFLPKQLAILLFLVFGNLLLPNVGNLIRRGCISGAPAPDIDGVPFQPTIISLQIEWASLIAADLNDGDIHTLVRAILDSERYW